MSHPWRKERKLLAQDQEASSLMAQLNLKMLSLKMKTLKAKQKTSALTKQCLILVRTKYIKKKIQ